MNIKDFAVAQYVRFNDRGAFEDRFQLEFGGTFIEDITREDLKYIQHAIDSALLYSTLVKKSNCSDNSNSSSAEQPSTNINRED